MLIDWVEREKEYLIDYPDLEFFDRNIWETDEHVNLHEYKMRTKEYKIEIHPLNKALDRWMLINREDQTLPRILVKFVEHSY